MNWTQRQVEQTKLTQIYLNNGNRLAIRETPYYKLQTLYNKCGEWVFDTIGQILGITSKQLDDFFETKDYRELIDENTTDTDKSDIQDELDTTESKSDETDTDILE